MELLYALLGGLVVLFFLKKDNSTEARAENLETKEKILEIEKEKIKTDAAIQSEEIKREELKKEITEKTNEVLSPEDLVNFFNNRKP
jgi:hypothetical protein